MGSLQCFLSEEQLSFRRFGSMVLITRFLKKQKVSASPIGEDQRQYNTE